MRLAAIMASTVAIWAQTVAILPPAVDLKGPEARHQLVLQASTAGYDQDWTRTAQWTSSNPAIIVVDGAGLIRPAGDGEARITATANGKSASITVRASDFTKAAPWSFKNHVIPVLTKQGCNQGACHGALAGKNGFKLTLRGYDPEVDHDSLVRQSSGRRVSLEDPENSLMLRKATFTTPHGGGKRFAKSSLEYRIVAEWIAQGAAPPNPSEADVIGIEVFPKSATLKPGDEQQLIVRAKYSDGRLADVTNWVKFSSNNEGAASVDDFGRVKINGPGEAAITLYYSSRVEYARMLSPYPQEVAATAFDAFPRNNLIDGHVVTKLKSLRIAPSKLANDATYIRRVYLDAAGILPTAEEVENFLADQSPTKRQKLVDALLEREEFVDYWAYKWSDLLMVSGKKLRSPQMWAFYNWIRDSVKTNKPWDQFARDIFSSSGSVRQNGALNYFVLHKDPIDITENVTQAFLGQRLMCARCHNHPLEKWTQRQYYQMANLFTRVGVKNGTSQDDLVVFTRASGDINHPRLLRPLDPAPLDGDSLPVDSSSDRRTHFANWLTSPKNPFFARAIVNRVWANFFGTGIVEAVDDVRVTNPASNEDLFAALAKDFIANGHDIKRLIRTIVLSGAYQLSGEANAANQNDSRFYSKYNVKRLPAEVILDAMSQVTGVPTQFPNYPAGYRALQLPDTLVPSQFLTSFGRPQRALCDVSERSSDPTVAQALHLVNGETLNRKLSDANSYLSLFLKVGLSERRIVDQLYLSAFARYPSDSERKTILDALESARQAKGSAEAVREARKQALEDTVWSMLTSKEFLFNH